MDDPNYRIDNLNQVINYAVSSRNNESIMANESTVPALGIFLFNCQERSGR
jgi:hypothetical protein